MAQVQTETAVRHPPVAPRHEGDRRWEFRPLRGRCRCEHRRSCAGDACLKARSAALQSGIAAAGRETPNLMSRHGAGPNGDGGTPSPVAPRHEGDRRWEFRPLRGRCRWEHRRSCAGDACLKARSAALQSGIAAAGRETPNVMPSHGAGPNGDGGTPGAPLRAASRPRPRNSQRHAQPWRRSKRRRRYAIPRWRHAMRGIGDGSFARSAGDAGVNTGAPAPAMPA